MTNSTNERLENIDSRLERLVQATSQLAEGTTEFREDLAELKQITRQQAETAKAEQQTIQQFAVVMAEQVRTLSRVVPELVESSRRASQAAEAASILAQNNQNAIRDLIEELRQGRA